MTDTTARTQDSATLGQISIYLRQLILHDMLARAIEAQEKGEDCLPLLKSLNDYVESHRHENDECLLINELCSLAARAEKQRSSEPCADDSVLDGQ